MFAQRRRRLHCMCPRRSVPIPTALLAVVYGALNTCARGKQEGAVCASAVRLNYFASIFAFAARENISQALSPRWRRKFPPVCAKSRKCKYVRQGEWDRDAERKGFVAIVQRVRVLSELDIELCTGYLMRDIRVYYLLFD